MILTETADGRYLVFLVNNITEELIASFEIQEDMIDFIWNLCADAESWYC